MSATRRSSPMCCSVSYPAGVPLGGLPGYGSHDDAVHGTGRDRLDERREPELRPRAGGVGDGDVADVSAGVWAAEDGAGLAGPRVACGPEPGREPVAGYEGAASRLLQPPAVGSTRAPRRLFALAVRAAPRAPRHASVSQLLVEWYGDH